MFLMLAALWVVFEVPSQAVLQLMGKTGHQLAVARKGQGESETVA
ncbi:MAG: hypothetical protein R3F65_13775 [bacterium]